SDNYAGLHPEVLAALADANGGHEIAYGEDAYTARLQEVVARHVGDGAVTWPVFNGTGANVVALQALLPRWGAVVCAETAHINTDEGGAPERMGSIKLLTVPTPDGKLTPELVDRQAWGFGDEHRAQPLVVSITQTTELGTCYTPDEVRAIADHAHSLGMRVHLDGARISNAAATLGTDIAAFTSEAGVDVVSLGGTKNGALAAEAVVVVDPELATDPTLGIIHVRKLSMQLASKMRFVSAQLVALYEGDLWLRS
ncbi:threonine aldolase family protein, partial [Terrabacter terrae]|uniref:threonine aldolase family protein n=1 Tax=Terrabacter terrae TaxID=318434 RepID=UPI0031D3E87A